MNTMSCTHQCVVLVLYRQRKALNLPKVENIVRAVEVTPLTKAQEIVIGVALDIPHQLVASETKKTQEAAQ